MFTDSQLLDKVNNYISDLKFEREPQSLYEPIKYILSLGGKRIRPVLLLMAYNLYKEDLETAMPQALAIELYHNFTLLHDDLMDRSEVRRGKPTVHKVWNDNMAILSGDAMLIYSYHLLSDCSSKEFRKILDLFNNVSLEICEGQQLDLEFESRMDVTEGEYLEMILLKTAVLLASSLKIGALLGGASEEDAAYLYDFGIQTGIAFQLKDDFLDVYGDTSVFGKKIGGDILCNKKTYMLIKAFECADETQRKELMGWIEKKDFDPTEKINAVIDLYNQLNIRKVCEDKMRIFYDKGIESLLKVNVERERKEELMKIAEQLMYREM